MYKAHSTRSVSASLNAVEGPLFAADPAESQPVPEEQELLNLL